MSEHHRVLFDTGEAALIESYIPPFKDCESPEDLYRIIDLVIKGKLYPYAIHGWPCMNDSNHPGTMKFEKFKKRLQEEKAKPVEKSDWLMRYPQLANEDQLREKYNELRAEACKKGIALPEDAFETGNAVADNCRFEGIPHEGKLLIYKEARQCYINIGERNPELKLPRLPNKKNNIIEGLQDIQDLCRLAENKPQGKGGVEIPTVTPDELKVLNYLVEQYPLIKYLPNIEADTNITRKTISNSIMPILIKRCLAETPKGKTKGFVATEKGKEYIEKHFS